MDQVPRVFDRACEVRHGLSCIPRCGSGRPSSGTRRPRSTTGQAHCLRRPRTKAGRDPLCHVARRHALQWAQQGKDQRHKGRCIGCAGVVVVDAKDSRRWTSTLSWLTSARKSRLVDGAVHRSNPTLRRDAKVAKVEREPKADDSTRQPRARELHPPSRKKQPCDLRTDFR